MLKSLPKDNKKVSHCFWSRFEALHPAATFEGGSVTRCSPSGYLSRCFSCEVVPVASRYGAVFAK